METVGGHHATSTGRAGAAPGRVFAVIAGALLVAVFLNASELEQEAKAKPFGRDRDIWVNVWKPFATVSRAVYLDRPRAWLDDALDRDGTSEIFELPPTVVETPSVPVQLIRTPTSDDPLRVWVGGDSMSKILGEALVRQATETGLMTPVHETELSSGLTRPDFYDWPGKFNKLAKADRPNEVFVVMFGANDAQGIETPEGDIYQDDEQGWSEEYRRRVAGAMDVLNASNRLVVWVGQPVMDADGFSEKMGRLNDIYREEAAKRPWVRFLDLEPLFVDEDGKYDPYIVDDDGESKLMRHPDGVHLVREGGERAARHIVSLIKEEAKIP